jgi:hypothetical protein
MEASLAACCEGEPTKTKAKSVGFSKYIYSLYVLTKKKSCVQVEFETGVGGGGGGRARSLKNVRPVYTSAGPCLVARKPSRRTSKHNGQGEPGV